MDTDEDFSFLAPDTWLSPEDCTALLATNQELLARNQALEQSLLASESEIARLQALVADSERTWANKDKQMHEISLANQAREYEAKLQAAEERNAQLTQISLANQAKQHETQLKALETKPPKRKSEYQIHIETQLQALQERNAWLENEQQKPHLTADTPNNPFIQDNMRLRRENTDLQAVIKEFNTKDADTRARLDLIRENTALNAQIKLLVTREASLSNRLRKCSATLTERDQRIAEIPPLKLQIAGLHAKIKALEEAALARAPCNP